MNKAFTFTLFFLCFISFKLFSQTKTDSIAFINHSLALAKKNYTNFIKYQSGIFNGREYVEYDNRIKGHPYFFSEYQTKGSVMYNGQIYDSIDIRYNVHKDILLVEYFDERGYGKELTLNKEGVKSFQLFGHEFKWIDEKSGIAGLKVGFYDQLFVGKDYQIIVLREKDLKEEINTLEIKREFLTKDKFYVVRNNVAERINSKGAVLRAFKDHKKEIKKFIVRNNLNFKFAFETSLIETFNFYNNL